MPNASARIICSDIQVCYGAIVIERAEHFRPQTLRQASEEHLLFLRCEFVLQSIGVVGIHASKAGVVVSVGYVGRVISDDIISRNVL